MVSPRQPRGCAVEYGPCDADAAGLAWEVADNLCAAASFAEGAFNEVRVPDAVMMFGRESQIGGEALAIGQHDLHRCRVGGIAGSERGQPGVDELDQPRTAWGSKVRTCATSRLSTTSSG
jgi:hypothetical protein